MIDFLKQIHSVNEDILNEYISQWEDYSVPKKTILTAAGETERYMYFVKEGIQKSYYINEHKEYNIAFTYPPSFSGIPESFLSQKPSKYFLEAITNSEFLRISYQKHQELMNEWREIETLFRKATEFLLIGTLEKHYELMAYDIETRFISFARRSPHLLNMISQKDIASYLRIDQTNLSKLINSIKI